MLNGTVLPGTDQCRLSWEERSANSYYINYGGQTKITEWENMVWSSTSSATFTPWWRAVDNMKNMNNPGWYNDSFEPIVLHDTPRLPGVDPVREFHLEFRISIISAPGCPCKNASKTISARMSVKKDGKIGGAVSSLTFTLL
jgi:hypothetical protein